MRGLARGCSELMDMWQSHKDRSDQKYGHNRSRAPPNLSPSFKQAIIREAKMKEKACLSTSRVQEEKHGRGWVGCPRGWRGEGGTHATRQSLLMVSASKCAECKRTMQSVWLLVREAMIQEHDVTMFTSAYERTSD